MIIFEFKAIFYFVLVNLEESNNVLISISSAAHETNDLKLKEIQHASYIAKIYHATIGNGNVNQAKYERNLQVLNEFGTFTTSAAINIENIIIKLKNFETEIEEVKYSLSKMDHPQTLSVDIHIEILKHCSERLHEYKQRLNGRINESNKMVV